MVLEGKFVSSCCSLAVLTSLFAIHKWKGNQSRFILHLELETTKGRYKMKVGVLYSL